MPTLLSALKRVRADMDPRGKRIPEDFSFRKKREKAIRAAARVINKIRIPAEMACAMDESLWARLCNPRKNYTKEDLNLDEAQAVIGLSVVIFHLYRLLRYKNIPEDEIENIYEEIKNIDANGKILAQEPLLQAKNILQREAQYSAAVKNAKMTKTPKTGRKGFIRYDG